MRASDWDAIAASQALNREASVVRDGSGDIFVTNAERVRNDLLTAPLPTRPQTPGREDFSGRVFGRFRIIGLVDNKKAGAGKNATHSWLAKCACGYYQRLKNKTVVKWAAGGAMDQNDRCFRCVSQANILKGIGKSSVQKELRRKSIKGEQRHERKRPIPNQHRKQNLRGEEVDGRESAHGAVH